VRRMCTAAAFALATAAAAACGGSSAPAPTVSLTPMQQLGREAAQHAGCASCHGADFAGGVGPGWVGLAGSERRLVDGSTVVADRDYLVEAIADPSAKRVAGYSLMMPGNSLSDTEIARIVDYIEALG
jgi:cytochrome c oxidase subunit 2